MSQRPTAVRVYGESGQMAGIEVIPFGFLTLVVGALLLLNAWEVVDAKLAVSAAAREATRSYVESSSESDARQTATTAAETSLQGHGRDPRNLKLTITNEGGFNRCVLIATTAEIEVPSIHLPFIGGFGRRFAVSSTHHEVIDPYRSGLSGEANCG